jgi:hypothetical protein
MSRKRKNITYKVWLEIEEYDEKTGRGTDMDAPGSSLAAFDTYEDARDYAERVSRLAEGINI